MKLLAPIIFIFLFMVVIKPTNNPKAKKPRSCGYKVIEATKGIDCNGDTITLTKDKHGWRRAD